MLSRTLRRIRSEETGFSLIELLVVVVIIGILAAIAIPAFLGQREKAQDSEAKSAVRTAQGAAEAYGVEALTYAGMNETKLKTDEPSLNATAGFTVTDADSNGYVLKVDSKSTGTFTITKEGNAVTRTCGPPARESSGGCTDGNW